MISEYGDTDMLVRFIGAKDLQMDIKRSKTHQLIGILN